MENSTLPSIVCSVVGLFSIIASLLNWDLFFESGKAQFILKLFGRQGARIFYIIAGVALIVAAIFFF